MTIRSGLAGQIGYVAESTWGTAVTVTKFLPIRTIDGERLRIDTLDSPAIRTGRTILHANDTYQGRRWVEFNWSTDLFTQSTALLFKHALGTNNTTGAGPYTHTVTPGDLDGLGLTIQCGIPNTSGTQPFTYDGCKINTLTIGARVGEIATMEVGVLGQDETTGTALATYNPSATLSAYNFTGATLTIAGSAVSTCRDLTLTIDNRLSPVHVLGSNLIIEPQLEELRQVTGAATVEFESLTAYNRWKDATQAALVATFTSGTNSITATLNVRFDATGAPLSGPGKVLLPLPFTAVGSTDAAAITVVCVNGDSAA